MHVFHIFKPYNRLRSTQGNLLQNFLTRIKFPMNFRASLNHLNKHYNSEKEKMKGP
jgi:hypothetical protein